MSNPGPYRYEHTVVVASDKTTTRGGYYDTEGGALNGNYTDFDVGCMDKIFILKMLVVMKCVFHSKIQN